MVDLLVVVFLRFFTVCGRFDDDPVLNEDLLMPLIVPVLFERTVFL